MKALLQTLTLIGIMTAITACTNVGFDKEAETASSNQTPSSCTNPNDPQCSNYCATHPNDASCINFCAAHPTDPSCTGGNNYHWLTDNWGSCSKTCGGGTQTRTVVCKDKNNATVADSFCSAISSKPSTSQTCNTQPCNPTQYTYSWLPGNWGTCSKSCGGGTQTRTNSCKRNDNITVNNSYCDAASAPSTSQACNAQACPGVTKTKTVTLPKPQVDIVLMIDTSMTNVNAVKDLTNSLPAFFNNIKNQDIDWQACILTTDVTIFNTPAGVAGALLPYAGEPLQWAESTDGTNFYPITGANPLVINGQTANLDTVLSTTAKYIQSPLISPGMGNAQGIGALYKFVQNYKNVGCLRQGAALASILLSAKDENATYGSCNRQPDGLAARGLTAGPNANFCQPPADYENPGNAKQFIASQITGAFTFNSIIVQPGDTACLTAQTIPQPTLPGDPTKKWWSPAFYGNQYVSMSGITNGAVSSICQSVGSYASNLNGIKQQIVQTIQTITLDCVPMAGTTPTVEITPNKQTNVTYNGPVVNFNPALPSGTQVKITYKCLN